MVAVTVAEQVDALDFQRVPVKGGAQLKLGQVLCKVQILASDVGKSILIARVMCKQPKKKRAEVAPPSWREVKLGIRLMDNQENAGSSPVMPINIKLDLLGTRQVALRRLCERSVVTKQEVGAQLNEVAMIRGGILIRCPVSRCLNANRQRSNRGLWHSGIWWLEIASVQVAFFKDTNCLVAVLIGWYTECRQSILISK